MNPIVTPNKEPIIVNDTPLVMDWDAMPDTFVISFPHIYIVECTYINFWGDGTGEYKKGLSYSMSKYSGGINKGMYYNYSDPNNGNYSSAILKMIYFETEKLVGWDLNFTTKLLDLRYGNHVVPKTYNIHAQKTLILPGGISPLGNYHVVDITPDQSTIDSTVTFIERAPFAVISS